MQGGYRIKATGEVIPWDHVRETPGEAGHTFHRCSYAGDRARKTIGGKWRYCFWAPQGGF